MTVSPDSSANRTPEPGPDAANVASPTGDGTRPYDFRRRPGIPAGRKGLLATLYEDVGKAMDNWFLSRVRGDVTLALEGVEQLTFADFAGALPAPGAYYTFAVSTTGGQGGVIDLGRELAWFLVDRLFGGSAEVRIPDRAMTPLERMSLSSVVDHLLSVLQEAWRQYVPLELTLNGFEGMPDRLSVVHREDQVLAARFNVTVGQQQSRLGCCLPMSALEAFFAGRGEAQPTPFGSAEERAENARLVERALRATRIPVSARLPHFRLSLRELVSLQHGSLVATGIPRSADIDVIIGDQRRFQASPGRVGSNLAVRLTDDVMPAPESLTIPLTRNAEARNAR